jgi:hypothetical protein
MAETATEAVFESAHAPCVSRKINPVARGPGTLELAEECRVFVEDDGVDVVIVTRVGWVAYRHFKQHLRAFQTTRDRLDEVVGEHALRVSVPSQVADVECTDRCVDLAGGSLEFGLNVHWPSVALGIRATGVA